MQFDFADDKGAPAQHVLAAVYAVVAHQTLHTTVPESLAEAMGIELAEVDLDLRGEGTLMSSSQKGRSDLKLASLRRDRELVELAREAAFEIVDDDPGLEQHADLADELDLIFSDRDEQFLSRS